MHFWKIGKNLLTFRLFRFAFVFLLGWPIGISFGREIVDATLTKVVITDFPKRIVTLAPSLGELAADILGTDLDRIVGVSEYTDYPPSFKKKTSVGPYHQFNLERVLSLRPDLVLATMDGNPRDRVNHLRELGIPVVIVKTENFKEIKNSILLVASTLGLSNVGVKMAQQLENGIETIRKHFLHRLPLRVLIQVGDDPLIVAGGGSFLHSALETVGAKNLYGNWEAHYPRPALEDVFARNPDVIIIAALGDDLKPYHRMKEKWAQFYGLKAASDHRIYILRSDALLRPTLRILEGLSELGQTIYGKK